MDFSLSDEQEMFRQVLVGFVRDRIMPVAHEYEKSGKYPDEIVSMMCEMGLFGVTVPVEYGGLDVDTVSMAIVFEELSRGWMGVAGILGSHSIACRMIARHGTEDQKRRFLPELATGKRRSGIALTEPGVGSDLQSITTSAIRDGDEYIVTGTKMWITNARHADPLPVLVKTSIGQDKGHRGMSVLLIEAGTAGFEVSRDLGKLGYKGPETCEVVFAGARVPVANLLGGEEGKGFVQVMDGLELGRVNVAARSVGIGQAAFDLAFQYSQEREAFGKPIIGFQAIQLKLADMATQIEAARLMTWWAASRLDAGGRADVEAGMAKLFASEVAIMCALEAMRVHGGYGYSTEFDVERLYRDAPLMAIGEGTNDILRTVITNGLLRRAAVGT